MLQASGVCQTFGFVLKSGEQKICFDACCLSEKSASVCYRPHSRAWIDAGSEGSDVILSSSELSVYVMC